MESNESQTGSGFIPALSNNVTAGELTLYHSLLSFCRNIVQYYEHLHHHHHHHHSSQHPITLTLSSIIHPHHYQHQQTKLTFKNVEIHLCNSYIIAAVLIKYNLSLQSFTHRYITWISPSVHLLLHPYSIMSSNIRRDGPAPASTSRGHSNSADLWSHAWYSPALDYLYPEY